MPVKSASLVYDIECLDDLYQAYYDGEINSDIFSTLLNSYNVGGLMPLDLAALGALERNDLITEPDKPFYNDFWSEYLFPLKGKAGLRRYSKDIEKSANYYYVNWQRENIRMSAESKESEGENSWRKRALFWPAEPFEITIGNYTADEGYGLAIGRFDYRPSVGLNDDSSSDFIYPLNSYYNGIKFAGHNGNFGGRFYYSEKKYNSSQKTFIGSGFDYNINSLAVGFSLGYNRFVSDGMDDNRLSAGINIKLSDDDFSLSGEYAYINKSNGLFIRGERRLSDVSIRTEFWHYDDDFNSYNCSGPSASDYQSFYPDEQNLGFRSAQAGEAGMAVKYFIPYMSFGLMLWSNSFDDRINSSFSSRFRKPITSHLKLFALTSVNSRNENRYFWLKAGLDIKDYPMMRQSGMKLYFIDNANPANDKSYTFLKFSKSVKDNFTIFLNIRNYFNGYNRLFIGEEFISDSGINIIAEAAFYKGIRVNIKIEKML